MSRGRTTVKLKTLTRFPNDLQLFTRCGEKDSLYATHSVYGETRKQRNMISGLSKTRGYDPPRQTCCSHQISSLARLLSQDATGTTA